MIDNLFAEHTARLYANGCAHKACVIAASKAAAERVVIMFNPTALGYFVGWTLFSLMSVSVLAISGLILFQHAEKKRYGYRSQDFIDVTSRTLE